MSTTQFDGRLSRAVELRQSGRTEEALEILLGLHDEDPENPAVNLQCAWAHDKLGLEREAVLFYEKALGLGLEGPDLKSALLGLGSTYRALGEYERSLATLNRGIEHFPDDRGIQVFRAMTLYNNGHAKQACETLLRLLADTTGDEDIAAYRDAIDTYADDLDRTWP